MNSQEILTFWFEELTPQDWFVNNAELDATITQRFRSTFDEIIQGVAWSTAREALAQILVLDQFSRNVFRDSSQAFAHDGKALAIAQEAIEKGLDQKLQGTQRRFLYMPFMHSESKDVHVQALELFTKLGNANTLKYEQEHKAIIDRFGRYPHRNTILGRESIKEEIEFLATHQGF